MSRATQDISQAPWETSRVLRDISRASRKMSCVPKNVFRASRETSQAAQETSQAPWETFQAPREVSRKAREVSQPIENQPHAPECSISRLETGVTTPAAVASVHILDNLDGQERRTWLGFSPNSEVAGREAGGRTRRAGLRPALGARLPRESHRHKRIPRLTLASL